MNNLPAVFQMYKSLADLRTIAADAVASRFYQSLGTVPQAMTKIMAGLELGIPPITSLAQINIIKDKPTASAALIGAMIKRDIKYDYRITEATDAKSTVEILERIDGKLITIGTASFTIDEAKTAMLLGKDNWKHYPSDMLFCRALTRAARRFCPDSFMGSIYTPDELGEETTPEGELIETKARCVSNEPAPPPVKEPPLRPEPDTFAGGLVQEAVSIIAATPITDKSKSHILDLFEALNMSKAQQEKGFAKYNVEDVNALTESQAIQILTNLETRLVGKPEKEQKCTSPSPEQSSIPQA